MSFDVYSSSAFNAFYERVHYLLYLGQIRDLKFLKFLPHKFFLGLLHFMKYCEYLKIFPRILIFLKTSYRERNLNVAWNLWRA